MVRARRKQEFFPPVFLFAYKKVNSGRDAELEEKRFFRYKKIKA